jgi:nitrite reductase (NADH) large subunit
MRMRLVLVGHGMVGHRLLVELAAAGVLGELDVTVFGEEPRPAYDRVALSSFFDGASADDLGLVEPGFAERHGVRIVTGDAVTTLDRGRRTVMTASGEEVAYDHLVLATGSSPFVPPMPGVELPGCFVYRTIDDLEAIRAWAARPGVRRGVVIGGGLLGLEAANALRLLGLEPHVAEMAPRLMPVQLDDQASAVLRRHVEALGVTVHTAVRTAAVIADADGAASGLELVDDLAIPADLVVFSAGIRPRDGLARSAGLAVGERGGILVDDTLTALDDPAVSAIGEVAAVDGRCFGLVAPGYDMARVVAARLAAQVRYERCSERFGGADLSTKLKLLGVDVASFGDAFGSDATEDLVWSDARAGVHRKLVVDRASGAVVGGMLVGDAEGYQALRLMASGAVPTPDDLPGLVAPRVDGPPAVGPDALPDAAPVCSCENVTAGAIREAVAGGAHTIGALKSCTAAGSGCGGCVPLAKGLLDAELVKAGVEVDSSLCEHFAHSRAELFALVRFHRHRSWRDVLDAHGTGRGCEICKPTVASILASLGNGYILDGDQAAVQDTNDHSLANMQRNGTYSVVPRVPAGEITPAQLVALGHIAEDFGLYTKITGGQRIDLFGARLEQLPEIWQRVIDAGMESGHAYGKALRTVKSCVGETWCRYGVQDSTSMAIALELRYRGLRSPHKLKMAVSGCTRECAEARSKDVGVIATEKGWNLYVCGNGGSRPRHADLLATDLTDDELLRAIDRFLAYYIRTADRLQRTASWFETLDGGLDHLRDVIFDDALAIAAELDADIAHHVDTYECEWAATLADPDRLARFVSFVNAPGASDPELVMIEERGQLRPLRAGERETLVAIR